VYKIRVKRILTQKCEKMKVLYTRISTIDQKQYFEVMIALIHNIPVLALNINGRITKRVVGIEKYFDAGIRKRATLKLADVLPN